MEIGTTERATELYVSYINGDRQFVMDEISEHRATMTLMAEICLKFLNNGNAGDLRHFLQYVAKYA